MAEIYLPTLHAFAMDNAFTGSCGKLRFRIVPKVEAINRNEVDMENSTIFAEYWYGPLCYEKSEIEGSNTFPLSEQGRQDLKKWLEELA